MNSVIAGPQHLNLDLQNIGIRTTSCDSVCNIQIPTLTDEELRACSLPVRAKY